MCVCTCVHVCVCACACVYVHAYACVHAYVCVCAHNLLPAGEDRDDALEFLDVVLHVNTMEGQVAALLVTRVLQHSGDTTVGWEIGTTTISVTQTKIHFLQSTMGEGWR